MKKFTTQEIRDLLNQVYREEISFSRMVEILNERVSERMGETNEPQYKDGDFVVNECGVIIIFKNKVEDSIYDHAYFDESAWVVICSDIPSETPIKGYATEEEKKKMLDELAKEGKRWNAEKKCVEDIQKPKFQKGDRVQIKYGVSSKTHRYISPTFLEEMDDFIGKTMTVNGYTHEGGYVVCKDVGWSFHEDWLEPYVEDIPKRKFKKGDKVRIKEGISSKTHKGEHPFFASGMDDLIGKTMTIELYCNRDIVLCEELNWQFKEDWLEPYTDELKKGDLAIFWDLDKGYAFVGKYDGLLDNGSSFPHQDHRENVWANAIKFESKEQYEKLIKGEI